MNKEDLKLVKPKYKNEIEIIITGDENDGDYVSETTMLPLKDFDSLVPVIRKIEAARKKRKPYHNWEDKEKYLSEDELVLIEEKLLVPSGNSDCDIHSIVSFHYFFQSREDGVRYELNLKDYKPTTKGNKK